MQLAVWLIERPRWFKRTVLIFNDLLLLTLALWVAYSLRLSQLYVPDTQPKILLMASARFIVPEGTTKIYLAVIIATGAWALVVYMSGVRDHPRSAVVIYGLIAALLI